jgi:hypothetical protein
MESDSYIVLYPNPPDWVMWMAAIPMLLVIGAAVVLPFLL